MQTKYSIHHMSKEEIPLAIDWAKREGWNPGLHDGDCFYRADPHGFFAGTIGDKIIALGSAVIYDEHFAFCGFYMVEPDYRGQGYGLQLTKERLAYVGQRNVGIDGVIPMLEKYERLGYQFAYNNARYCGSNKSLHTTKNSAVHPGITLLTEVNWEELQSYDRQHFPAPRSAFLSCWINQQDGLALACMQDGKIAGYGVIRRCYQGYKIGPLFADDPVIADALFVRLAAHAQDQSFYLDIPECNNEALNLVNRYQLEKVFATARMYLKHEPQVALDQIYGITSFELG